MTQAVAQRLGTLRPVATVRRRVRVNMGQFRLGVESEEPVARSAEISCRCGICSMIDDFNETERLEGAGKIICCCDRCQLNNRDSSTTHVSGGVRRIVYNWCFSLRRRHFG